MRFKNVIIGAGFCGSVFARLIAEGMGEEVLIVEKRNHTGGNSHDFYNESGFLVHKYGPHIFHTNNREVWDFLSAFTDWRAFQYRILAYVDGLYLPVPINLDTINLLYGTDYTAVNISEFFNSVRVDRKKIENSMDTVISKIGTELYEKFYKNYTKKQWGVFPEELSPEVAGRIPVRANRDGRYFTDRYQGVPKYGYSVMFENLLNHPKIHLLLNTDFLEIRQQIEYERLIFTGSIDNFFDYKYGTLPYRSLDFRFETINSPFFQAVATVNYPNDYDFTRITEFKHITGQQIEKTVIVKEYSKDTGEPFYPVLTFENQKLYEKYALESEKLKNIIFAGRLANYKYYNMDKIVELALNIYKTRLKI